MTSSSPSSCCNETGGCGSSSTIGAGSGCATAAVHEPSSSKSSKSCARCLKPPDVPTSSFGSAALCASCLREALRSRVAREAVDLGIKGQRVVVAWSGGPSSRLLAELLAAVAAPASYPGARPSFELVAAVQVDCGPWRRLCSRAAAETKDGASAASTSSEPASAASAASLAPAVSLIPIWLALAEEESEGLRRLELLHSSLEDTGNDDDDKGEGEDSINRRRRRPRAELATARRRAERALLRAALLRSARLRRAGVVATAETATRCAASAVAAAAAGVGAALPLEVAGCDRRFCLTEEEEKLGQLSSVSFVRPFVSVPASDVEAAAKLLGLSAAKGGDEKEEEEEQDGVLAAAAEFLGAAQLRVPSTATSVVAALGKLAPCGWAGRRQEDASRCEPPERLCDLCAAGPWSSGDGAEVEVEVEENEKEKLLLRLCYPCATVALGAPPAPAGASPVVPRAAARKLARALFAGGAWGGGSGVGGLWGKRGGEEDGD